MPLGLVGAADARAVEKNLLTIWEFPAIKPSVHTVEPIWFGSENATYKRKGNGKSN